MSTDVKGKDVKDMKDLKDTKDVKDKEDYVSSDSLV